MAYKTILVSLNEVSRVPQLIAAAILLGRTFGAHIAGLYVVPAVQVYPSVGFEAAPQVFEGNRTFFKDNAERVKTAFESAMKKEGLTFDFHLIDARTPIIADDVIANGRSADLVVVSATNPDEITGVERDFVEQTIMAVGRPVIVLPFALHLLDLPQVHFERPVGNELDVVEAEQAPVGTMDGAIARAIDIDDGRAFLAQRLPHNTAPARLEGAHHVVFLVGRRRRRQPERIGRFDPGEITAKVSHVVLL